MDDTLCTLLHTQRCLIEVIDFDVCWDSVPSSLFEIDLRFTDDHGRVASLTLHESELRQLLSLLEGWCGRNDC